MTTSDSAILSYKIGNFTEWITARAHRLTRVRNARDNLHALACGETTIGQHGICRGQIHPLRESGSSRRFTASGGPGRLRVAHNDE